MDNPILHLGDSLRKRQAEMSLRLVEPQIRDIRADYERQIADRDEQIEALSAEISRLRDENAALKGETGQGETGPSRVQPEPAPKKKAVRK